ncbi:SLC13 family permease [Desulfonatronum parangueonense]
MTTEKIKNPPGSENHEDLIEIGRQELRAAPGGITKVLLVDDEDQFRSSLAKRLASRGYEVLEAADGEQAMLAVRHDKPQVVVLDQKMPKMEGIETLEAIKELDDEVQVIMLTGHATMEAARVTGKREAFAYMQKPAALEDLIEKINSAREEYRYAQQKMESPHIEEKGFKNWFFGREGYRPGFICIGFLIMLFMYMIPAPDRLVTLMTVQKGSPQEEMIMGYAQFRNMQPGQSIAEFYGTRMARLNLEGAALEQAAMQRAKIMVGVLMCAALFWATTALPLGISSIMVGVFMYWFGVFPPNDVAKAFATDAVVFIFGVLAMSIAIGKTGLDRRIGLVLLKPSTSIYKLCLIFAPMVAICASFLSEHALIAFIGPILMMVYIGAIKAGGITKDKTLVIMLLLTLNFACNVGGPGSPAAGGRNVIMITTLSDYGISISFGQWVMYGLPFVPLMAVIVGLYFYLWGRNKVQLSKLNISAAVRRESEKLGKWTTDEYKTLVVLVVLIFLWSALSHRYGMGGPVILALVALSILKILRWKDITKVHWNVILLYAAASAMGFGLAQTGGALWIADTLIGTLPAFLTSSSAGMAIAASIITGVLTNFMSDGATVAALGPIIVPSAIIAGVSPVMVGLATAFASSFAHCLIIGTPNNALIYAMAKDPKTGEQLLTTTDFFKHGVAVLLLSWLVLWFWVILGYWQLLPFPA